jgi:hypothetical protein
MIAKPSQLYDGSEQDAVFLILVTGTDDVIDIPRASRQDLVILSSFFLLKFDTSLFVEGFR